MWDLFLKQALDGCREWKCKTASYENIHKQYENVTRNMAYAKNLRPKAPNVNNSKILNPKV